MEYNYFLYLAIALFILGMVLTIIGITQEWYDSSNNWFKALFWISVIVWIVSVLIFFYWLMKRPKTISVS